MDTADPTQVPEKPYKKNPSKRMAIALILIIGPTILIVLSFILYAVVNFATNNIPATTPTACNAPYDNALVTADPECAEQLFGEQAAPQTAFNIALFVLGAVGIVSWLPGMIIGAILIAKRPKNSSNSAL